MPQQILDGRLHAGARDPAARFQVEDRALIEPGTRRHLGLGQPEMAAMRVQLVGNAVRDDRRVVPEERDDQRPVPD